MQIELNDKEIMCLLFWFVVFREEVDININCYEVDRTLFKKLRTCLESLDKEAVSLTECGVTGIPRYQPGEKLEGES